MNYKSLAEIDPSMLVMVFLLLLPSTVPSQLSVARRYNFVEKLIVPQREGQHSPTTHYYDNNRDLSSYRELSALRGKDTN